MNIKKWFSSIFPILRSKNTNFPTRIYTGAYSPFFGGSARSVSTVFCCVDLISTAVAMLPLKYQRKVNGVFVDDDRRAFNYILNIEANETTNAFDFWRAVVAYIILEGNAYVLPIYDKSLMDISGFILCNKHSVSYDEGSNVYKVSDVENGINGTYKPNEILHFKGIVGEQNNKGLSVLHYASLTIDSSLAGNEETLKRFSNGGTVKGIVTNEKGNVRGFGEYQDAELNKTAEDLDAQFKSGVWITSVPGQADFKQIGMTSADMQFLESRKFEVREICRFFRVHPSFVFDDTSNNYKSAEIGNVAFLSNTLNAYLTQIEKELFRKLIGIRGYNKFRFQFLREYLNVCDLESKINYQSKMIATGLATVNELREQENKPSVKGGDKVLVSANLKNIDENETN